MTAPNLLDELEGVVRLMEAATPGLLQPEFVEAYNVRAAHGGIFAQIHNLKGRHGMGGRVDGNEAANNARLIASAINFLRTHHATLADMAKRLEAAERDARRYRFLRDIDRDGWPAVQVPCPCPDNIKRCRTNHTAPRRGDALDDAIDAAQEGEG